MSEGKLYHHKPHPHKPRNINKIHDEQLTFGQKLADVVASGMGSWPFIIAQTVVIILWIIANIWLLSRHPFDPFPFILLNLLFSTQSAYAAPIIMQSQNRQSEKDRLVAQNDFETDQKSEHHLEGLVGHLDAQDHVLLQVVERLDKHEQWQNEMLAKISALLEKKPRARTIKQEAGHDNQATY